eukprot:6176940-Pleurochrysis_carterae.AAC.1
MSILPDQPLLQTQEPLMQRPLTKLSAAQPVICQAVATVRKVCVYMGQIQAKERYRSAFSGTGCGRNSTYVVRSVHSAVHREDAMVERPQAGSPALQRSSRNNCTPVI